MGISLDLPSTFPSETATFKPPMKVRSGAKGADAESHGKTPFLWQSPNANAALYFGNKWMEFHSFLSNRLSKPPSNFPKMISELHPAWLEYMLELMRARGYSLLYPNFPSDDTALATVHSDLYHVPEEFTTKSTRRSPSIPGSPSEIKPDSDLSVDPATIKPPQKDERVLLDANLVSLLPASGDLPELANLPLMSFSGDILTADQSGMASYVFSNTFRSQTGTCASDNEQTARKPNSANDLFCHLEDTYDYPAADVGTYGETSPLYPMNGHPGNGMEPESSVHDDDMITQGAADEAKKSGEMASHLNRHNELDAPLSTPEQRAKAWEDKELYDSLHPGKSEIDAGDEWQNQFRAQMERQSKQQLGTKKGKADEAKTKAGSDDREKADEESKRDTATTLKDKGEAAKKEAEKKDAEKRKKGKETEKSAAEKEKEKEAEEKTAPDTEAAEKKKGSEKDADKKDAEKKPETHGSFQKEAPKPAKEADMEAIATAKEKSPGW